MLGVKKSTSHIAVQAEYFTFWSSNGKGNRFDLHEKLFMMIRKREFGVLWKLNMLGVKKSTSQNVSHNCCTSLLELCFYQKAMTIFLIFTKTVS